MDTVYLNGEYLPRPEARLPVEDRGFIFGDGVYEVCPVYGGSVLRMDAHLARLRHGLKEIEIRYEPSSFAEIHSSLLEKNGLLNEPMSLVYVQVTRGVAPRLHHFPPEGTPPTVFAYAKAFRRPTREEWEEGGKAITHPDRRWARADLKTIQLLPSVLAQEAARKAGASDAIMVRDGIVIEGAHSNLFFVFDGVLRTHPTSNQILPGITRTVVLEVARELGIPVEERPTPIETLFDASEAFLTGSTTEVKAVVQVDGRAVGDGRPGPLTRRLREGFLRRVAEECGVAAESLFER